MIKAKPFKLRLSTTFAAVLPILVSSTVFAHSDHSHAQHAPLTGLLHTLTTHPLSFGVVGLLLLSAVYLSRR